VAQAATAKAQEEHSQKQTALQTFDAKHSRKSDTDGEVEQLAPSLRAMHTRLEDDLNAATVAADAASAATKAAAASRSAAEAAVADKWDKVQLYWLKGLAPSLEALLSAAAAGVPLRALLRLHNPSQPPPADAPAGSQLYEQLVAAQGATQAWDDLAASIAAVDVAVGPQGGPFVPAGHYEQAGAAAVTGAEELQAALRALEACAGPYDKWAASRTVYRLAPATAEDGTYQKLVQQVPAEQQSVALITHCMLEQVDINLEGQGAAQAEGDAEAHAASLFDSVMERTLGAVELRAGGNAGDFEWCTVLHGDEAAMAARGLLSGHVRPLRKGALGPS
jgi:hypothetical protein